MVSTNSEILILGLFGGGIYNFVSGARNAPKNQRIRTAFSRAGIRAPILGGSFHLIFNILISDAGTGSFAVWGALFSVFDCSLAAMRRKVKIVKYISHN